MTWGSGRHGAPCAWKEAQKRGVPSGRKPGLGSGLGPRKLKHMALSSGGPRAPLARWHQGAQGSPPCSSAIGSSRSRAQAARTPAGTLRGGEGGSCSPSSKAPGAFPACPSQG